MKGRGDEAFYRAFFEHTFEAVLLATATGQIIGANPAAEALFGKSEDELCRDGRGGLVDVSSPQVAAFLAERDRSGHARGELPCLRADGRTFPAEVSSQIFADNAGEGLAVLVIRDLSERKQAEAEIQTAKQYYAALSQCNAAIVRATCQDELFASICQAAVKVSSIKLAWIGLVNDERRVVPVAWAGAGDKYLAGLHITTKREDPHGQGPTGTAIRENQPIWCQDFATDSRLQLWQERGKPFGWRASAALPLCRGGVPVGALTLYMTEPDLFQSEIRDLLSNMATDISFALDGFDREAERASATQALAASEQLLRQVLETSIDGIFISEPDGQILSANKAACAILGRSEAEITAEGRPGIIDQSDPNFARLMAERRQTGRASGELTFVHRDGHRIPTEVSSSIFKGPNGSPLSSVIMRDISDRKRHDAEIRKLSLAVEQSPESIMITDLETKIEYVNEAFVRVSGYSRQEALGQTPRILHSRETPAATYRSLWDTLRRGEAWKGQFVNRRKDGQEYTEFAIVAPIRQADGRVTHYLALKDDITEKKQMSEELDNYRRHLEELVEQRTVELAEARARAEDANLAKSAFLANMSHEIRTPMNAILGLTYLMRQAQPSPEQSTRLDKVEVSARHLLSLIDGILDLSKIEAGRMSTESIDFELAAVVRDVCEMIRARADEKGLSVTRAIADDVPAMVKGDPLRLRQVLINLGGNAVKFTEHGSVVVRVAMAPRLGDESVRIRFEIEDTGIGIDAEQRTHLFQPFAQADVSTTRRFGGTGLGLAISRRLIELMGGTVGVESTPHQGSTFWFDVPFEVSAASAPAARMAASTSPVVGRHLRVLVVEDEEINQEVARDLLESAGHAVEIAANGAQAVQRCSAECFDVVLMDLQMPVLDGLSATKQLRGIAGYADTPILAMTANAFEEDRQMCLAAGMNDFIAKPVDPEGMFATIRRWTAQRSAAPHLAAAASATAQDSLDFLPDTASDGAGLRRQLATVGGLDLDAGLAALQGNWAVYVHVLRRYATDHAADLQQLREHLAAGRLADATRNAHTIKGLGGTIGARQLQLAAARCELELHRSSPDSTAVVSAIQALESQHDALVGALAGCLAAAPVAGPRSAAVDWPRARSVMHTLEAYLVADDVWAGTLFSDNKDLLHAVLGQDAVEINALIQNFDFNAALGRVRAAIGRIAELGPQ